MPDIPNRDELEAEIARRFSKLSAKQQRELMRLLGNPPNWGNVPQSFWETVAVDLNGALLPIITETYLDAAERMVAGLPISVDWDLVNEGAVRWARQYTFELVRGITNTSRRAAQQAVSAFFEQGLTFGDLETMLSRTFGPSRAEAIAVTEVTRAASEGEQEIARDLERQGVSLVPVWRTNNDELVCPICGPRHNQQIEDNFYPPAHPRCRCWVNHEIPKVRRA